MIAVISHDTMHEFHDIGNDDEVGWEIVHNPHLTIPVNRRVRLHYVVRRVVRVLRWRWLWSCCMSMMNTPRARRDNVFKYQVGKLTAYLHKLILKHKHLFTHVHRIKGKLLYTDKDTEERSHVRLLRYRQNSTATA